jgi:putative ABC transport system permease protein
MARLSYVAVRMLIGDKLKYYGLVAGLAFSSFLIAQQASIFTGYASRTTAWLRDSAAADLWIVDPQVEFTEDTKSMTLSMLNRVRGIDGVAWAVPMFKGYVKMRLPEGSLHQVRVIGIDDASLIGGPPTMVEGALTDLRQDKALLVDQADLQSTLVLKRAGEPRPLRTGDTVSMNDSEARVVGIFRRHKEFFWEPMVYTTFSRALQMAPQERKMLTYVLARVKPGENPEVVAEHIEATTGMKAYTAEKFQELTLWYTLQKTGILINFGITIGLGFVIGVLVSGQLLYNFILDNTRYFGTLKAMGTPNKVIVRMVMLQAALAGAVGYGIGLGIAGIGGFFLGDGDLAFRMTWQVPVFGLVSIVLCCIIAGTLSILRVLRIEPAIVFKA